MARKKKAKILEMSSGESAVPDKSLKKKSSETPKSGGTGKETPNKLMLKDMDKELRPREKFKKLGVSELEDYELLAIMLRTGIKGESVLDFSRTILSKFKTLEDLYDAIYDDL
ncbi:MAG: hypothetical protein L0Y76_08445, partial [Ignavibacteria bacterium]|nr:hypothetical protein [Ignavibacteria bacterium]